MRYVYSARPWTRIAFRRSFAIASSSSAPKAPQTVIEKVVQKYAVGLTPGKVVRAGDYVMIQPEHVMTHDNTGPVISKCVCSSNSTL
jgi:homoaconitate hydratase